MRQTGISNARAVARAYITRLGVTAPGHLRIEAIAKRIAVRLGLELRIVQGPLDGADSQLVRLPGKVIIVVSDRIRDRGSRKFVIAHELGHLVLDHPSLPPHTIGEAGPARRAPAHRRDYESEANAFASELTMPYVLVSAVCRVAPITLEEPRWIASAFGMSLLASAIRVVELSPERCAAVFCADRRVLWCAESATFTARIRRDRPLGADSVARTFWDHAAMKADPQGVPASAWLDTRADVQIAEHSTASPEFRTVLSMLWISDRAAAPLGMAA